MQWCEPVLVLAQEREDEPELVHHARVRAQRRVPRDDQVREAVYTSGPLGRSLDIHKPQDVPMMRTVARSSLRKRIPAYFVPGRPQPSWKPSFGRASYATRHARVYSCCMYRKTLCTYTHRP